MNGRKSEVHFKCSKGEGFRFTVTKCVNYLGFLPGDKLNEEEVRNLMRVGVSLNLKVVINAS